MISRIALVTTANKTLLLAIVIAAATFLHWAGLVFHLSVFDTQSGWFWLFIDKPLGSFITVSSMALLVALLIFIATHLRRPAQLTICSLIVLGTALQINFALLEGRGMDGIRDRIIYTGHAEFAKVAVKQDSIFTTLHDYEDLISAGELGVFPRSKSPGTLLTYMLTKEVATLDAPDIERRNKALVLEKLRTTASYLWPVISYLVLIPIFFLTRLIMDRDSAILACVLYLTVPSINLMTLHTDQTFYPLLFILPIVIATFAAKRFSPALMFLAGCAVYFAMWFSFALMFSFIFALGISFFSLQQNHKFTAASYIKFYIGFPLGFLALHLLFKSLLNYDFLVRYEHATQFHFGFKGWEGGMGLTLHFAALNITEFFIWVGMPIVILMIAGGWSALSSSLSSWKISLENALPLLLPLTLVIIALIGKTKAETARLWLFLVPLTCIVAAHTLIKKWGPEAKTSIAALILLQIGTTYLTKTHQDFF